MAVTRLDGLQHVAYELTIEGGVVVAVTEISRAPNLPGIVIGNAETHLWQIREQADISLAKDT